MAPPAWDEGIDTGVDSIDTEHRLQVSLVNALDQLVGHGVDAALVEDGRLRVLAGRGRQALPHVITALDDGGYTPQSIEVIEPNLETVFLHLTGRALRD